MASVRSVGRAMANGQFEYDQVTINTGTARLGEGVRLRLGVPQGLADGVAPDPELFRDLPRAQAVTMGLPNPGDVVHSTHPDPLRPATPPIADVVLPRTWIRCRSGPELD